MTIGDQIWFIDVGHSRSLTSPNLPLSIYKGVVTGVGSTLVAVNTRVGVVCFHNKTGFSQNFDYKMFEELKLARQIIKQRRNRIDALRQLDSLAQGKK